MSCKNHQDCMFWTLDGKDSICFMKTVKAIGNRQSKQNLVSGSKNCPGIQILDFIQWYNMTQVTLKPQT